MMGHDPPVERPQGIMTFHLFVKSRAVEPVNHADLQSSVISLKHLMDTVCTGEVIIPLSSRRPLIIKEFHESVIGGHQGIRKLFDRIREDFYWPRMGEEIKNFVRSCPSCQRNKILSVKTRQPMRITDTPSIPTRFHFLVLTLYPWPWLWLNISSVDLAALEQFTPIRGVISLATL